MHKFYLFIDTTQSTKCCLSIYNDKFEVLETKIFETQNNLIDLINPALNEIFNKTKLSFSDINHIYVNIGPGVFSGIRVGVSVTKTFHLVYPNIEIYTINSLKLKTNGHGIGVIDAKSNKFFVGVYEHGLELLPPQLIEQNELDEIIKKYHHLPFIDINQSLEFTLNASTIKLFEQCQDVLNLEPLYIKPAI